MSKLTLLQQGSPSREQIREQIRQTIVDAQKAAQEAATESRGQGGDVIVMPQIPPRPPGTPGVIVRPWDPASGIPPQVESISIAFFVMVAAIIIGLPIMRAIGRRIERGAPPPQTIPAEVRDQLQQITHSVEAIAIEVERISEGQRFQSKMLADRSKDMTMLPQGRGAEP
ncbi:MAG: hypothetical protein H0T48_04260 [Gemmatimonadaceae bacterium]|nr:hypothetical protein [Gemmatimonadaceae bacterium]